MLYVYNSVFTYKTKNFMYKHVLMYLYMSICKHQFLKDIVRKMDKKMHRSFTEEEIEM